MKQPVTTVNPKIGKFIGIIILIVLPPAIIYAYIYNSNARKELIENPKAGDIYTTKIDKKYSLMRPIEVKGDSVWLEQLTFSELDREILHDRDWTFEPLKWTNKAGLKQMYDDRIIIEIRRPQE